MTKRRLQRALADLRAEVAVDLDESEREQLAQLAGDVEATHETVLGNVTVEWAQAKPEARPSGIAWDSETATVTYDLWAAQRECLDALREGDADIVAFLAGYGTGKSIFGARWLIAQALAHPGSRFLAMGIDFTKARDTTFRILKEQLPGTGSGTRSASEAGPATSPIVADYTRSDHRLVLENGSVIVLGSGDDWTRHAGDEFGGIWLDEPSHYSANLHDLLEMLGGRLRGVDGPQQLCWTLTGNGYNGAWEIIEQRQDETGDPIGLEIDCVRASTLANPYLAEGTRDRFKRQYEGTGREAQALEGAFAAAQGLVYSGFRRDRHVVAPESAWDRIDDEWRCYGYDAGWADPRVVLELGRAPTGQLVVLDEFYERESHIEAAIEWLEAEGKPRGKLFAEHDPADIAKFSRAGYRTRKATKDLDSGIADVRRRLGTDDDGRVGLVVSRDCEHLIGEFLGYKTEDVGTGRADDHCLDALRYAVHGLDQGSRLSSWDDAGTSSMPEIRFTGRTDAGYYG